MIAHKFDFNSRERTFVAHGGGMMSVCATLGTLMALRSVGIAPTSFTIWIATSAGVYVAGLVADGRTLEEIARIVVPGSFEKMFPRLHSPSTIVARCRLKSHSSARHYALGTALYGCNGQDQFWNDHMLHGFPEGLCVLTVDDLLGQTFAFTGHGSFVHARDGEYFVLGGPPKDIVPVVQATKAIPAVMPAPTGEYAVGRALGNEAVQKLPCPDSYMLDGGLARRALDLVAKYYTVNRQATFACWAGGPDGDNSLDRKQYSAYTKLLPEGILPKDMQLFEEADRSVCVLEPQIVGIRALDFAAAAGLKLWNIFNAMDGVIRQLAEIMDVPPWSEIKAEQAQIAYDLNCQPTPPVVWYRHITNVLHPHTVKKGGKWWRRDSTALNAVSDGGLNQAIGTGC